jgi:hypothetical protein
MQNSGYLDRELVHWDFSAEYSPQNKNPQNKK